MRLMKRGTESVTFPPKTFRHFMLRLTRFPCGICAPFNHSRWHVVMMSRFDPEIDDRRKHVFTRVLEWTPVEGTFSFNFQIS